MMAALTDAERFPLLTPALAKTLKTYREHPAAPRFNYACGDRLTAEGLKRVRAFEAQVKKRRSSPKGLPPWIEEKVDEWLKKVPFYRQRGGRAKDFETLPAIGREDLLATPWAFVPDGRALDDLMVYETTGTTGAPLGVMYHPEVPSMYLVLLRSALKAAGVELKGGPGVALLLVGAQEKALTFVSGSTYLDGAGYVKVNLKPSDWRRPEDRATYLSFCSPEVVTGDPVAFQELLDLKVPLRPKALVSTSLALAAGLRKKLESTLHCPVLDVYSMTECRPLAASTGGDFEIIPPDVHVEILDDRGRPLPDGRRGEVAITGGRNDFLPLIRYRTGDHAAMVRRGGRRFLKGLEGRAPVVYLGSDGRRVPSIDIARALGPLALSHYVLHQRADGSFLFKCPNPADHRSALRALLEKKLGSKIRLSVEKLAEEDRRGGKVIPHRSDVKNPRGPLW
ncbi:MAG TPA: capsule biosynthesis protein CapK [Elusimicrobiota bacterium]|nr:capsule biosynthesis protein CapK [Elusimicrobiota bacterium]